MDRQRIPRWTSETLARNTVSQFLCVMRARNMILVMLAVVALFAACRKDPAVYTGAVGTPYELNLPAWVHDSIGPMHEGDNPLTVEGVALGRKLFYEKALSNDGTMSCATCHHQEHAFTDPRAFSVGTDGSVGTRNAMAIVNLGWSRNLFWDGRRTTLEGQAHDPVTNPIEMRNTWPVVEQRLRADDRYPSLFAAAFGSPLIDSSRVVRAIAQFERTLVSFNSRFDRYWYGGDTTVLDSVEKHGLFLFRGKGKCGRCHSIGLFTDDEMRNNGLDAFPVDGGLGTVTGAPGDFAKFKTTTLRNIAVTAPYMHDSRFADLMSVIQFYDGHIQHGSPNVDTVMHLFPETGNILSWNDRADLIAFLQTLTDEGFLTDPAFSEP